MKHALLLLGVSLLLLSFHGFTQQADITINIRKPAGLDMTVEETVNLTIINNEDFDIECYVTGTIDEEGDGRIAQGQSQVFIVEPGTNNINSTNVDRLEPANINFNQSDYEDYINRTNKFPPGTYTICIRLIQAEGDVMLAEDCFTKTVDDFIPPSLIEPENGAIVEKANPFFSWSPSTGGAAQDVSYEIRIVEILDGQSPLGAFEANPLWFQQEDIINPIFQYPLSAREFEKGSAYAWKVISFIGGRMIGESEVWKFSYKTKTEEEEEEEEEPEADLLPKKHINLKKSFTDGYYLLDDFKLNFSYQNKYDKEKLDCKLEDNDGKVVASDFFEKEQKHGLNLNEVDVSAHAKAGRIYTLQCRNTVGESHGFRFMIRKEDTGTGIEDINTGDLENLNIDQIINPN